MVERNGGSLRPTTDGGEVGDRLDASDAFADRTPRAGVDDELVRRLRAEGLLSTGRGRGGASGRVRLLRAAASVMLFAAGWAGSSLAGRGTDAGGAPAVASTDAEAYMLLIWEGDDYVEETSPGERATEYEAWARSVAARGVPITGRELGPPVDRLAPTGVDGPSDPTRVSGYFVLETSAAEAVEMAEGHPHRAHGGWVEVVPVR